MNVRKFLEPLLSVGLALALVVGLNGMFIFRMGMIPEAYEGEFQTVVFSLLGIALMGIAFPEVIREKGVKRGGFLLLFAVRSRKVLLPNIALWGLNN